MRNHARLLVLALLAGIIIPPLAARPADDVRFAPPVRLKAGDAYLGAKRILPSPAVHDVNTDGTPDVVIGDLHGNLTVANGGKKDGALVLGPETPMLMKDGEKLKFHNW